jgi:SNF family Na+-dependent transporter
MEPLGKSPIAIPLLITGKIAMLFCWLFFLSKSSNTITMHYDSLTTQWIGIALYALGLITVSLGFLVWAVQAVSSYFRKKKSVLKTGGIYRNSQETQCISRVDLIMPRVASCLFNSA